MLLRDHYAWAEKQKKIYKQQNTFLSQDDTDLGQFHFQTKMHVIVFRFFRFCSKPNASVFGRKRTGAS